MRNGVLNLAHGNLHQVILESAVQSCLGALLTPTKETLICLQVLKANKFL
jgi:hypothetical protein